jgi:hypothetical protein
LSWFPAVSLKYTKFILSLNYRLAEIVSAKVSHLAKAFVSKLLALEMYGTKIGVLMPFSVTYWF